MRCEYLARSRSSAVCRIVAASTIVALGLALSACSSSRQTQNQPTSWVGANPPVPTPVQQQSAYIAEPGDPIKEPPVEPRSRPNAAPDDPNEPFSPNYGGARTRAPVRVSDATSTAKDNDEPARAVMRHLPDASRAYFRRTTTAAAD